jgi:hypothetical protein
VKYLFASTFQFSSASTDLLWPRHPHFPTLLGQDKAPIKGATPRTIKMITKHQTSASPQIFLLFSFAHFLLSCDAGVPNSADFVVGKCPIFFAITTCSISRIFIHAPWFPDPTSLAFAVASA